MHICDACLQTQVYLHIHEYATHTPRSPLSYGLDALISILKVKSPRNRPSDFSKSHKYPEEGPRLDSSSCWSSGLGTLSSVRESPFFPSLAGPGQGAASCKFNTERKLDFEYLESLVLPPHCPFVHGHVCVSQHTGVKETKHPSSSREALMHLSRAFQHGCGCSTTFLEVTPTGPRAWSKSMWYSPLPTSDHLWMTTYV